MEISRRALMGAGAALVAASVAARSGVVASPETRPLFASSGRARDGSYLVALVAEDGRILKSVPLIARGHDITFSPDGQQAVVFARRPGTFAVAFPTHGHARPILFTSPHDRHFYGHGVFSPDGRLLYASENAFEEGEGRIGIYDTTNAFTRLGELPSFGVGPHDLVLSDDGHSRIIANGGIETHPGIGGGRTKLNLATMQPNIAFVDPRHGTLEARWSLPATLNRVSLRHAAVVRNRDVIIGSQFQGEVTETSGLICRCDELSGLAPIALPHGVSGSLRGYITSIAVSGDRSRIAFTSAKGGKLVLLDAVTGRVERVMQLDDVSGVAPLSRKRFAITTGQGELYGVDRNPTVERVSPATGIRWDNHATGFRKALG